MPADLHKRIDITVPVTRVIISDDSAIGIYILYPHTALTVHYL